MEKFKIVASINVSENEIYTSPKGEHMIINLEKEYEKQRDKLEQIERIVLDRFCDWDMARCRIDFIINRAEE